LPCPAFEISWLKNYDPLPNGALSTTGYGTAFGLVTLQALVFPFTEIVVK
jgi:hypothetical protein